MPMENIQVSARFLLRPLSRFIKLIERLHCIDLDFMRFLKDLSSELSSRI